MGGTLKRLAGPAYVANAAADILTQPSAGYYYVIQQIQLANDNTTDETVQLFLGATGGEAGGTTVARVVVPASDTYPIYFSPGLVQENTKFLSGKTTTASKVSVTVMGESRVSSS
jgi:hypothetical protein